MHHSLLGKAYEKFCNLLFSLYCPLTVEGKEYLPEPPFILCSNHCSHMDTPALMVATGLPFDQFGMIAAKDYFFENSSRRKLLSLFMQIIPMERKPSRKELEENLTLCQKFCQQKQNLLFYPEGTRSLTGEMQRFKKGVACFAHDLHLPIVPAYVEGTFQTLRKGSYFPKPGKIRVRFAPPMYVPEKGLSSYRRATEQLETTIRRLA